MQTTTFPEYRTGWVPRLATGAWLPAPGVELAYLAKIADCNDLAYTSGSLLADEIPVLRFADPAQDLRFGGETGLFARWHTPLLADGTIGRRIRLDLLPDPSLLEQLQDFRQYVRFQGLWWQVMRIGNYRPDASAVFQVELQSVEV
jgi:hypothetical protein